jgi:hypothetical protein
MRCPPSVPGGAATPVQLLAASAGLPGGPPNKQGRNSINLECAGQRQPDKAGQAQNPGAANSRSNRTAWVSARSCSRPAQHKVGQQRGWHREENGCCPEGAFRGLFSMALWRIRGRPVAAGEAPRPRSRRVLSIHPGPSGAAFPDWSQISTSGETPACCATRQNSLRSMWTRRSSLSPAKPLQP